METFRPRLRIDSVAIQHYKSLSDVNVSGLSNITVLVGSNGAGKSNFIDALRFLRDAVVDGLEHAITIRQGIEIVRQYSKTRPYDIRFRLDFTSDVDGQVLPAYYELEIGSQGRGSFRVKKESCSWSIAESHFVPRQDSDPDDHEGEVEIVVKTLRFDRSDDGQIRLSEPLDDFFGKEQKPPRVAETELALGKVLLFEQLGGPIANFLGSFAFTVIYPNVLRSPGRPDTDLKLRENGENWASVIKSLRQTDRGRSTIESIIQTMRAFLPQLKDVHIRSLGGYLVPQFLVQEREDSPAHYFDPVQLSDGTLRVFGILLSLYQVPSPPLLALEEPELTIQPGALPVIADAFAEAGERTQIIVSSHSPNLVDLFNSSSIRLVTMEHGETTISPVSEPQRAAVKASLTSIKELMVNDNLRPAKQ